jgi:hypothetical protein
MVALAALIEMRLHPKAYAAVSLGLAAFAAASWLAHRLAYEREFFFAAVHGALSEGRTCLSFLPLVGYWFEQ